MQTSQQRAMREDAKGSHSMHRCSLDGICMTAAGKKLRFRGKTHCVPWHGKNRLLSARMRTHSALGSPTTWQQPANDALARSLLHEKMIPMHVCACSRVGHAHTATGSLEAPLHCVLHVTKLMLPVTAVHGQVPCCADHMWQAQD